MIMARDWPFTHPEVYHQNAEAVRAGGYGQFTIEPYRTFLLFPRTPVYELCTPIPVSNYFPLMQSSWWDNDFQKYGHPALNISSTRTGQSYPLQSSLNSRYNNFKSVLSKLKLPRYLLSFPGYWCLELHKVGDRIFTYSLVSSAACWKQIRG